MVRMGFALVERQLELLRCVVADFRTASLPACRGLSSGSCTYQALPPALSGWRGTTSARYCAPAAILQATQIAKHVGNCEVNRQATRGLSKRQLAGTLDLELPSRRQDSSEGGLWEMLHLHGLKSTSGIAFLPPDVIFELAEPTDKQITDQAEQTRNQLRRQDPLQ